MAIRLTALFLVTAGPAGASPFTWGGELAVHSDFSVNEFFPSGSLRYFPPSAAVTAHARWRAPGRVEIVGGVGYDHRVRTDHISWSFGATDAFEFLGQVRERAIVFPLAFDIPVQAWSIAPGVEWRHVSDAGSRLKWVKATIDGEVTEFPAERRDWNPLDPSVRDRWAASIAVTRVWRGAAGSRSLGLRWVHGLTDVQSDPDVKEYRRSLQLVLGWSH